MSMSQHLANAFYRNIIAQTDLGSKSMAGIVVSQMLVEVTLFLNHLECLTNAGSCRNKEHVPVLAFALVFLNDTPWNVKQRNDTIRISLLACDVNPLAPVFVRLDVTLFEIGEVSPANAGEAAEHKKVSCMAETVGVQFKCIIL